MSLPLPTKMSQFESVNSLSTSSYLIGLDMYSGQLANIKISDASASQDLSRKRWILNPPVSASNDLRGDDGAESYSAGQHWVKSGSVWIQLIQTGSAAGGTISSSYQLSDGGGNAFGIGNNVTFGRLNSSLITGSTLLVYSNAYLGTNPANTHVVTGSLSIYGNTSTSGKIEVAGGITGSLLGTASYSALALTASYALAAKSNNVYNVKDYGAVGDGTTNDTNAIQAAINAVQAAGYGTVYFPDGIFKITGSLTVPSNPKCDITLEGDGSNISVIKQTSNTHAVYFDMNDGTGWANDYQVSIKGIAFKTSGQADTAIYITYGNIQYSQHQNISVDINDVHILSDGVNYWNKGIILESAWNFRITNTMVVGQTVGSYPYNGTGLEIRRMCVNGSINQSQFNFWNTGIFVNTVDYTSTGMNTEGLFIDQVYMVPVHYGVYVKGNKNFSNPPFNVVDWANRYIAGRMVLFTFNGSHIDSRNSGSALILENVQSHYITNNLMITDGTGSVVRGLNAHEGSFIGNTLFNAGTAPSIYIGGYSGSANIITGNVFRGGNTHVMLESSSLYNKVYGNVAYNQLSITVTDSGSSNLVGSVGN